MGWHSFRRFRETHLRRNRCLGDVRDFWAGHMPETMSELYSHIYEELQIRLEEAERVAFGFTLPQNAPNAPSFSVEEVEPKEEIMAVNL